MDEKLSVIQEGCIQRLHVFSLEEANIAKKFRQPKFTRRNENKFSYSLQKLKICLFYVAVVHPESGIEMRQFNRETRVNRHCFTH